MDIPLYLDETTPIPTELPQEIVLGEKIPSVGMHSEIYEAFIDGEAQYLAKVMPIEVDDREGCPNDNLIVRNEILISQDMSALGIGPTVRAAALNKREGILVLDRYDGSLSDLLLSYQEKTDISLDPILQSVRKLILNMHESGVIHRDITPNNILYNNNGQVVLADYGLAIRSTIETVRADDWAAYDALITLVNKIIDGERFTNKRAITRSFYVEGVEPLTFIWKGNICSDWI